MVFAIQPFSNSSFFFLLVSVQILKQYRPIPIRANIGQKNTNNRYDVETALTSTHAHGGMMSFRRNDACMNSHPSAGHIQRYTRLKIHRVSIIKGLENEKETFAWSRLWELGEGLPKKPGCPFPCVWALWLVNSWVCLSISQ